MPFDIDQIAIYVLLTLILVVVIWIARLEMKIKRILLGKDAKSLEDSIVYAKKEIDKLKEFESDSIEYFKEVEARLRKSIQSVETVRFNPFKGTGDGGNQSFSTSFVNENGDGVVISSMYSRDRISIFAKPINKFKSQFEIIAGDHHARLCPRQREDLR
jgi:hypothetical protein